MHAEHFKASLDSASVSPIVDPEVNTTPCAASLFPRTVEGTAKRSGARNESACVDPSLLQLQSQVTGKFVCIFHVTEAHDIKLF